MSQRGATLPAGLHGLGNTCWLNATLQALASCSSLLGQLQQAIEALDAAHPPAAAAAAAAAAPPAAHPSVALTSALSDCLRRLQPVDRPSVSFSPRALLDLLHARLPAGALEAGEEHDAAEGLELLCNLVAAELQAAFAGGVARQLLGRASLAALLSCGAGCGKWQDVAAAAVARPCSDGSCSAAHGVGDATSTLAQPSVTSANSGGSSGVDHGSGPAAGSAPPAPPPDPLLATCRRRMRLPLQGSTATELQCARCRHRSWLELAPFWVLPLGVPTAPGRTLLGNVPAAPGASLDGCLAAFFGYELLQGWHCTRCSLAASLEAAGGDAPAAAGEEEGQHCQRQRQQQQQLVRLRQTVAGGGLLLESEAHRAAVEQAGVAWLPRPSPAVKRCVAAALPRVLCLQLRRGFWSQHGHVKITGRVAFPLRLTLPPALVPRMGHGQPPGGGASSSCGSAAAAAGVAADEASAAGRAGGGNACSPLLPPQQPPVYLLRAVVVHHGVGAGSGHYTSYRCLERSPREQAAAGAAGARWACASDQNVRPAAVGEVLAAEASLLVYEQLQERAGACEAAATAAAAQQQAVEGSPAAADGEAAAPAQRQATER